jgi:hypothetical protein
MGADARKANLKSAPKQSPTPSYEVSEGNEYAKSPNGNE